ncbi:hypothetical protein HAX54_039980 [Datura stramonium]|uniref:Uncharacterized protein n=1 Tax=Datura stramonium TaxID=4076 RepID=A0ABS8RN34_DATST|nr:hypothetical protein [Datura stramonium]
MGRAGGGLELLFTVARQWRERENRRDGWPLSNGVGEREEEGREVGINGVAGERVVGEAEKMRGPAMLLRRR